AGFTPAETRVALKRKLEPSYMGTYTGARRYVLHTFANTQSALMPASRRPRPASRSSASWSPATWARTPAHAATCC
ncbi:hypothetical protein C7E12_22555, partial [Stenotrophomonas maltophilia]